MDTNLADRVRDAIAAQRKPKRYTLPNHDDMEFGIRCLTRREMSEAQVNAMRATKKAAESAKCSIEELNDMTPFYFDSRLNEEIVRMAFCTPESINLPQPQPAFASAIQMQELGDTFIAELAELYLEHTKWISPVQQFDAEELSTLIDQLGKAQTPEASRLSLGALEYDTLRDLVIILARRLSTAPTSKSSGTSPGRGNSTTSKSKPAREKAAKKATKRAAKKGAR